MDKTQDGSGLSLARRAVVGGSEAAVTEQKTAITDDRANIRVPPEVHRRLLTIQYQRKMAGEQVTFGEIIAELLDKREAS